MLNNQENKNVLITGAAGFIGMHVSIGFLKKGYNVIGLDNMNSYYSVNLKNDRIDNIENCANSLKCDFIFLREDLNSNVWNDLNNMNIDTVIHLAAQAGVRYSIENPNAYLESNILGFQKVLEFVNNNAIDTFLYASSSSVYGKDSLQPFNESAKCASPESYYAATKKTNELMAYSYWKTKYVKSIGLRFFTVYGSWGRPDMAPMLFAKAALNNEKIKVFNHGVQKRDFTHIDDIVNSILLLTKCFSEKIHKAEIVNIGNGSPTNLLDFIESIEKSIGLNLQKEFVDAQLGDVAETYADDTKLNLLIGDRSKTILDDGIIEFINWFKSYYEDINH
jgi:UDP-glucuronate 4-epimerase